MVSTEKKYVDPTEVLSGIQDNYGQNIPVGDQKDIGEFMINFLSRVNIINLNT